MSRDVCDTSARDRTHQLCNEASRRDGKQRSAARLLQQAQSHTKLSITHQNHPLTICSPPLPLLHPITRAIIINCLPLRETHNESNGAAAAAGTNAPEAAAAAANQGAGRGALNDASEQRFRLMKQLPQITVRVRRWYFSVPFYNPGPVVKIDCRYSLNYDVERAAFMNELRVALQASPCRVETPNP
jgi:hypothetical protein